MDATGSASKTGTDCPMPKFAQRDLYRETPDRIADRLQENAGRENCPATAAVDLSRAAGREASGLVNEAHARSREHDARSPSRQGLRRAAHTGGPPLRAPQAA